MIRFPFRSKLAALIVLFFLGTFAGQLRNVLETVRGRVEDGARITEQVRDGVGQANDAASNTVDVVADLTNQVADLQARLSAGTATPDQVESLRALVVRLQAARGTPGPAGPTGPPGPAGTSPPTTAPTATSTTGATTTTTRAPTATTRPPTTTTTRCTVGLGRLLKVGCT